MTIGMADVLAWLKALDAFDGDSAVGWTIAKMDASKLKQVGVWQRGDYSGGGVMLGGRSATLTWVKRVQVLVHWNRNAKETEEAARALYDAMTASGRPAIGGATASYIDMQMPEPADVGADDNGVFEQVIWLDIHYQEG